MGSFYFEVVSGSAPPGNGWGHFIFQSQTVATDVNNIMSSWGQVQSLRKEKEQYRMRWLLATFNSGSCVSGEQTAAKQVPECRPERVV